jgi:AraC family transcriptional regulator
LQVTNPVFYYPDDSILELTWNDGGRTDRVHYRVGGRIDAKHVRKPSRSAPASRSICDRRMSVDHAPWSLSIMQDFRSGEFFDPRRNQLTSLPGVRVRTADLQPGFSVSSITFGAECSLSVLTEARDTRVHFSCPLGGKSRIHHDDNSFMMDRDCVLASFAPGKRFQLECGTGFHIIELRIAPRLLGELAGQECACPCLLDERGFQLLRNANNFRIHHAASQLGRLLTEEQASPLLVHAAALEFLAWQLHCLQPAARDSGISPRERRQLLCARDLLLDNLSRSPTIAQLAHATGLNQLKIKRGFKALFGISVYALFQRERMEHARRLLARHNVTETALLLGYSNISHFSDAFRKQFGVLPGETRRGCPVAPRAGCADASRRRSGAT